LSAQRNLRLIARLDVKGPDLIKGVNLEGVRKLGDPQAFAQRYYAEGVDEIIYIDAVASLYGRNNLNDIVRRTVEQVFVPITVGGGVRSVEDAQRLLRAGADKIAVNTAAVARPELIDEIARTFGSQCMVLSIQAKRKPGGGWEAYTDLGREHSGLDVLDWARRGQDLGAGDIRVPSVERDGTLSGFDVELTRAVTDAVEIPVIASGGMGTTDHLVELASKAGADAAAIAHVLHYGKLGIGAIRAAAQAAGLPVRNV
jgi:cyclase